MSTSERERMAARRRIHNEARVKTVAYYSYCPHGTGNPMGCGSCEPQRELREEVIRLRARVAELESLINTPQTEDFLSAVKNEVAHQRERWGKEHDEHKTPPDWFWLIGYLVGKALHKPEKRLHHIITTAAALAHWHRQESEQS